MTGLVDDFGCRLAGPGGGIVVLGSRQTLAWAVSLSQFPWIDRIVRQQRDLFVTPLLQRRSDTNRGVAPELRGASSAIWPGFLSIGPI